MRVGLLFISMFFLFPTIPTQAQEDTAKNNSPQTLEDGVQKKPVITSTKLPEKPTNKQAPIEPFKPTEAVPADAIIAFPTDI